VIGAGPNGLAAAIVLAQAGWSVDVYEAEAQPGGGARTMELTLPGFRHDFGSAVHPMAVASPFLRSLPLGQFGLEWVHGEAALAHPLDDGTAVMLEHALEDQVRELGRDGSVWRSLVGPVAQHWWKFAEDGLGPPVNIPRHPWLMAQFGMNGLLPAEMLERRFSSARAKALFAGLAGHSFLRLDQMLSSAVGLVLGATAHVGGWPVPRGGAQAITDAMIGYLASLGGRVHCGRRVDSLAQLEDADGVTVFDVGPKQLLEIAGARLTPGYRGTLQGYKYGPGAFKLDWALSEPIPWRAAECKRAMTVHLGGTLEEIAASEKTVASGRCAESPFVLLAQQTLFDPSRAPAGAHTAWAYCHVPNGATENMTEAIESQVERFAPGFRDCVLARSVSGPRRLEDMDANLRGGDVNGGLLNITQFLFRPGLREYRTGTKGLYLCSASTPPGGGVHGMCGFHAAQAVLRDWAGEIRRTVDAVVYRGCIPGVDS
jgi:phytoene dehydrogenase-like protein